MFVGRSTNAPVVVGSPDFAFFVFFNTTTGCRIGGNCCATGSVAEEDVEEDSETIGGVGGRGTSLGKVEGKIVRVKSSSTSSSPGVSSSSVCKSPYGVSCDSSGRDCATENGVVLALAVPALQDCRMTSRLLVNSQLSTYSQSLLRGVIPVGTSSRVACSRSDREVCWMAFKPVVANLWCLSIESATIVHYSW